MKTPLWFFWLLIALSISSPLMSVWQIGRERKPITPSVATGILVLDGAIAVGIFLLVPH